MCAMATEFMSKKPYVPPTWAAHLDLVPSHFYSLGLFPTPIHKWNNLPNLPKGTEVYIKRDDLSGLELSGNKSRKLEFAFAEAVADGADCVITIGAIQSNHCRSTAVAAKYLNLDCYLILVTSKAAVDKDPGLNGNLLGDRLVGAHIDLVSQEECDEIGIAGLTDILKEKLLSEGRKPYVIPAGGSSPLTTWGYIEAVREIKEQLEKTGNGLAFDDIVVASGSAGTAVGLSLGSRLSGLGAKVHAYSIFYDIDRLYEYAEDQLDGLGAGVSLRDLVTIKNASGRGYALSTKEELMFIKEIAEASGIFLDPVYSGKAAYAMMRDMAENPGEWEGRKVLFVHTGGFLGFYGKIDEMAPLVGKWRRMNIRGSVAGKEGSKLGASYEHMENQDTRN